MSILIGDYIFKYEDIIYVRKDMSEKRLYLSIRGQEDPIVIYNLYDTINDVYWNIVAQMNDIYKETHKPYNPPENNTLKIQNH